MKLTHSVRYDAPVADVYAMLTDPDFRERASRAQDALEVSVTIPGQPGSISGTRRLVADGQATLDTFDGEATARIPLVGGKIEKLIGDKLKNGWDIEHGVGIEWLEERR